MSNFSETNPDSEGRKKRTAPRLEKLVAAYATAATAAAGGVLLSAQGAEAKIVYTQTTATINSTYALDLNHDGVTDFDIEFCDCLPHGFILQVGLPVPGNLVRDQAPFQGDAAALLRGAAIGPKQAFTANTSGYGGVLMALDSAYGTASFSNGPWAGVKNRFLGLKFLINGEVHYGWARLTVAKHVDRVVLTGYAYETIANKSLQAGQTTETSADGAANADLLAAPPQEGPSLGMLARGADALDVWRRRDPISTTV